jgi:hypothetical protein
MTVKLVMQTNLGTTDAKRMGIAPAKDGQTIEVEGAAAEELLKRGWAVAPKAQAAPGKAGA